MKPNFSASIASEMSSRLQSEEHLALFNNVYKLAGEKCEHCHCAPCRCDSAKASDSKDSKDEDSCMVDDSKEDSSMADDSEDSADADDSSEDSSDADDEMTAALETAAAHILTASAMLDGIGFEKSAAITLDLAGFLVEAKKKAKDKKKSKKSDSKAKSSKSDSKKSDSKKDSKKSDSKAKSSKK